ncbi:DUF4176 domain-containing protein [Fictibacillus enclensis]|uniref:DUF4176 domain-containing protein n=1 Tax=Fictibacillus enclensis TaxID=1017270 RepID=A0A0V8J4U5_9BACL|nr:MULTISPECIES: DUF4176 domain-containing protein [Fictibacillus]KSU82006.1 hypothetical protein AS030_17150 [Fictibacillus enclensis]MDM5201224.1 DUF4176 domain-containing protein [Fictibacillus enclensis]MDM5340634.1 DUF4176 domain-containing protein [Fictibacillus enclensis]RXZ01426.1 DUF4176 domain-containing protein [Fictibacillus sp. S7]WHY72062.1 DUF4176 domain-containing protein [Fictibacillus enclensis]
MTEKFPLPIGTVVTLEGSDRPVMIYGRMSIAADEVLFDYIGCSYPIGHSNSNNNVYFQHCKIQSILHKGYISDEEEDLSIKLEVERERLRNDEETSEEGN